MAASKKRVLFFVEPEWAFGSVHYELCKYLWAYAIDGRIVPWNKPHDTQAFMDCVDAADLLVSTPGAVAALTTYNVPPNKMVLIAHHEYDINTYKENPCIDLRDCAGYAVITNRLAEYSKACGIERKPTVTHVGINTNTFYQPVAKSLERVGYAGSWGSGHPVSMKRPHLVQKAAEQAGLSFDAAVWRQNSFTTMPGWYGSVGAVMVASTTEGAGMPSLEAGAAGRLMLTSPVGSWPDRISSAGGIVLPLEEDAYVAEATAHLLFYKNNPEAYRHKCEQIQEHAQSYDWSKVIHEWVELLG
jgi:glycosyltransferase involved in cell wall biosynthesis